MPRAHDQSFSPEGYIQRREVICAIENLRSDHASNFTVEKAKLLQCFGFLFDPLDKAQIKNMLLICRKQISVLEVLSESTHTYNYDMTLHSDDSQELCNQDPWTLRKNVCQFLNVIVRGLKFYRRAWKQEELAKLFVGLKKSLPSVNDWSSVMKTHCGFKGGNEVRRERLRALH